jgi:hypothetical protein
MGLTEFHGLPAHVLFVHFVVVLIPLTALAVVACAARPRWARRLGLTLPALGLLSLAMVPVTTHAGEWLEGRVGGGPLLEKHTELGDTLLPWATGLFLASAAVWWLGRRTPDAAANPAPASASDPTPAPSPSPSSPTWLTATWFRATATAVALIIAGGAVVDVYRIGDSGAKAAWTDSYSSSPQGHDKG